MKALMAISCGCLALSAQAFQFGTYSHGNYDLNAMQDMESVDFYYYNGIADIPLDTLFLDGNALTGYLSGSGGADTLNFSFSVDNGQVFGNDINEDASWTYTGGTGAFANMTGGGSFSIDFYDNGAGVDSTTGLTGSLAAVPEPASLSILGIGVAALIRKKRKATR